MRSIPLIALLLTLGCSSSSTARDTTVDTHTPDTHVVDSTDPDTMEVVADVEEDTVPDPGVDTADAADDTEPDPIPDTVEDDGPCTYPPGPYGFDAVGNTVGPCFWPSAIAGSEETHTADFDTLCCDRSVQSILVFIATSWCGECPADVRDLVALKDHFDTYGTKCVWILDGASSASEARTYYEDLGVTFGWMTHDADNSQGAFYMADNPMYRDITPWRAIIDATSMRVAYNNPFSIERLTRELGTD